MNALRQLVPYFDTRWGGMPETVSPAVGTNIPTGYYPGSHCRAGSGYIWQTV